jgi:AraC family transcriptional regulator, regulatory protein of adaptative response / methylated-DNA-[protein]-cysteine methyltransferase
MSLAMQRELYNDQITDDRLWQAVLTRDAKFEGSFVYGVSSTQIYCRPSCPSRRPRRDRVSFFATTEAAEKAGFRACKRCHPGDTGNPRSELIQRACDLLERSEESLTLSQLSEELGVSSFHLQRIFKKALGISPRQYAASRRAHKFKEGVRGGQAIASAMYDAGYGSSSRLYEGSTAEFGMTPATYSRNGRGASINFAVAECELGWLLVAATDKGVCAVRLGSDPDELEESLRTEFSAAQITRDEDQLTKAVQLILEYLEGTRPNLNLPLDVQATAFQRLVWEALQAIPYGATRSYGEVANSIGRPTAVRAVARACATNPVALVVPCHRVMGSDKSLSGYRWGVERKKKLLEAEQKALITQAKG